MSSYTSSSYPSTPSLVSVTSTTSTTPLRHPSSSSSSPSSSSSSSSSSSAHTQTQKDYAAAFSALQSQYGWGPVAPAAVSVQSRTTQETRSRRKEEKKRKEDSRRSSAASLSSREADVESATQGKEKDYARAFGALSSRFGFGASSPSPGHGCVSEQEQRR